MGSGIVNPTSSSQSPQCENENPNSLSLVFQLQPQWPSDKHLSWALQDMTTPPLNHTRDETPPLYKTKDENYN